MSRKNMPGNRIIFLITPAFFKTYVIKSAAEKEIHTGSIASVDRSKKKKEEKGTATIQF